MIEPAPERLSFGAPWEKRDGGLDQGLGGESGVGVALWRLAPEDAPEEPGVSGHLCSHGVLPSSIEPTLKTLIATYPPHWRPFAGFPPGPARVPTDRTGDTVASRVKFGARDRGCAATRRSASSRDR